MPIHASSHQPVDRFLPGPNFLQAIPPPDAAQLNSTETDVIWSQNAGQADWQRPTAANRTQQSWLELPTRRQSAALPTLQEAILRHIGRPKAAIQLWSHSRQEQTQAEQIHRQLQPLLKTEQYLSARLLLMSHLPLLPSNLLLWSALLATCDNDCDFLWRLLHMMEQQQLQPTPKMIERIQAICQQTPPIFLRQGYQPFPEAH